MDTSFNHARFVYCDIFDSKPARVFEVETMADSHLVLGLGFWLGVGLFKLVVSHSSLWIMDHHGVCVRVHNPLFSMGALFQRLLPFYLASHGLA